MKKHILLLLLGFLVFSGGSKAQTLDSKFGRDSVKTIKNLSIYMELYKQKNYRDALPAWRYVFKNAPKYGLSTYGNGVYIMRYMIKKTKSPKYVDTLMMVYDQRIKYFGDDRRFPEGYILGRKAVDCFRFKGSSLGGLKEAYGYFMKSLEMQGELSEPHVLNTAFIVMVKLLEKGELKKDEMINFYGKFMAILDKQIEVSPRNKEKIEIVKGNIETLFFDSGVADCNTLVKLLTPKFEQVSENAEELKEMISLLKRSECQGELYVKIAEKLYKLEPCSDSAYDLAIMFLRKEEVAKAESYLTEAISICKNNENKADYLVKLARIMMTKKRFADVKKYAEQALKLKPNDGAAYILIGQAYAAGSKSYSDDKYEQHTVFWAAVDKFIKAKQVDSSVAEEAAQLIKKYSVYFPSKEDAFFHNIKPGDTVTIGSWINEKTAARF